MREKNLVAVLGAGNGGHAVAAFLALSGFKVNFFELPEFASKFEKVAESGEIRVEGVLGANTARLNLATTDIARAVDGVETIFIVTPAFGHRLMAEVLAPHVRDGQIVCLMPGTGGSLEAAGIFRRLKAAKDVDLAESTTMPFGARLKEPGVVSLFAQALILPTGVFPAKRTSEIVPKLQRYFPMIIPAQDVLEAAINNPNPIVHPAAVLFSAAWIEHSHGDFYLYAEGLTPAVARAFEGLNRERIAICQAMDYRLYHWNNLDFESAALGDTEEECRLRILCSSMDACFGLNSILPGLKMRGPADLRDRYITEDVPFGLVLNSTLGALLHIPTPTHDAVIQLASVINRTDYWKTGRGVKELGLLEMPEIGRLKAFLQNGFE
ncbi:MAG: NAD/NADP octopine/nopaline dehydrogenase family protein [Candidatus Aminicenantales bacterium]